MEIITRTLPEALVLPPSVAAAAETDEQMREQLHHMADDVVVTVSPRTVSRRRVHDDRGRDDVPYDAYQPDKAAADEAQAIVEQAGLRVHRVGRFSITISGPADRLRELLGVELTVHQRRQRTAPPAMEAAVTSDSSPPVVELFVAPTNTYAVASPEAAIDHFVFIPPPLLYQAVSATPPIPAYAHVSAADIRAQLNVPAGASADGTRIAIVDTGFADHPFYPSGSVAYRQVPKGPARGSDPVGHGTAMPFNVLAVAPDAAPLVLGYSPAVQDAIEIAVDEEKAPIVSLSWGWNHEQVFGVVQQSIRSIVADGTIVLVASGNGQYSWPSTMPEVISVGGVFADPAADFALEASSYASGFASSMYPGRNVPDVCGLCGQAPHGIYYAMPCPPGSKMDVQYGGRTFPDGDQTAGSDGWLVSSGTSGATPQVAAVVAMMLAKARAKNVTLTPAKVRELLQQTAKPVLRGRNAQNFPASSHPSIACGFGLVDAAAALARI